jgi:hypothetical protein
LYINEFFIVGVLSHQLRRYYRAEESLRSLINGVFASLREIVDFLDFLWPFSLGDSDHPEELVDIVTVLSAL